MLRELFNLFKEDSLLDEAYRRSYEMLKITGEMFKESKKSLREKDVNQMEIHVYDMDLEVNKYQREVRRNVFNHLVVCGSEDAYSALVLASVVIDIERIGDYTKNMVGLAANHPERLKGYAYEEDLAKIEAAVEDTFTRVPTLIQESDPDAARKLLDEYRWVNSICTQHEQDYVKSADKSVSTTDAVALALYFRYLKRVNSHLRNIATSVVNPFDYIGFTHKLGKDKKE